MSRNKQSIYERLGQAVDDPHLLQGHVRKVMKDTLGLPGYRAITMGRGNPVGALFPMKAPPQQSVSSAPVRPAAAAPKEKKRPSL